MLNVYKFYLLEKLPKPCDLSDAAAAMALNLAMVFRFRLLHEIKFPPIRTQYLEVDFLCDGDPAQSASE